MTQTTVSANTPIQAVANGSGVATAQLPQLPVGTVYSVAQITVSTNSVLVSEASIVLNNQVIDTTSTGNGDTASGDPAIIVRSTDTLKVVWAGCTPGASCLAVFFYTQIAP